MTQTRIRLAALTLAGLLALGAAGCAEAETEPGETTDQQTADDGGGY